MVVLMDGSDVDLTNGGEDIDAIKLLENGERSIITGGEGEGKQ